MWILTELFSLPNKLWWGYLASTKGQINYLTLLLTFSQLDIHYSNSTLDQHISHFFHFYNTAGVVSGIWQRWQYQGKRWLLYELHNFTLHAEWNHIRHSEQLIRLPRFDLNKLRIAKNLLRKVRWNKNSQVPIFFPVAIINIWQKITHQFYLFLKLLHIS